MSSQLDIFLSELKLEVVKFLKDRKTGHLSLKVHVREGNMSDKHDVEIFESRLGKPAS